MPLYDFDITDPDTGDVLATITIPRPILKRDNVRIRRREVPGRIEISGNAPHPVLGHGNDFHNCERQALRKLEEKQGSRFKLGNWSKTQLKEIHG